ncbi:MAG: hypothetical protein AAF602_11650 [Myxococcota bacterium]
MWFVSLLACSPYGGSVSYSTNVEMGETASFTVLASSTVPRRSARRVTMGMLVQFEDDLPREPIEIDVSVDGEAPRTEVPDLERPSLFVEADVDLFPCPSRCEARVKFDVRRPTAEVRPVLIDISLGAVGIPETYDPFGDLGIVLLDETF